MPSNNRSPGGYTGGLLHARRTSAVSDEKIEQFVSLLTRYQQRVYLFILSLVPDRADAEDVLQETNLVLWQKFDDFTPGSDSLRNS